MFELYPSVNYNVCHGDHRRCHADHLHGYHVHGYHDCLHGDDDDVACDDFLNPSPMK